MYKTNLENSLANTIIAAWDEQNKEKLFHIEEITVSVSREKMTECIQIFNDTYRTSLDSDLKVRSENGFTLQFMGTIVNIVPK